MRDEPPTWCDILTVYSIWLTHLQERLPASVSLEGLDVSFDATPPPQWLPGSIKLRHWDVKSDVPEDLIDAYDIVHIRNFTFVFEEKDIPVVVKNIMRILSMFFYRVRQHTLSKFG